MSKRIGCITQARGGLTGHARSNRIRGPAHGCQGSAKSQLHLGGNSTQILQRAELKALNRKGELSMLRAEVENTPEIIIQQTFGADNHNFDLPMGFKYADSRPLVDDDENSDWEEDGEACEAEGLKEKLREISGYRKREDYRTRCDRTDRQWKYCSSQKQCCFDGRSLTRNV